MSGGRKRPRRIRELRSPYKVRRARLARARSSGARQPAWEWIRANRASLEQRYAGRWIAVSSGRIVGQGVKLATALRQARVAGVDHPFVTAFKAAKYRGAAEVPHWL